jgi:hypothetical protein
MYGDPNGLKKGLKGIIGPWPCSECHNVSQFADVGETTNYIFCRNEGCDFERIIDKANHVIKEPDGTFWKFDDDGNKMQIRAH